MEDCNYMNHLPMGYLEFEALDEFKPPPPNYRNSLPSQRYISNVTSIEINSPTKKMKTDSNWNNLPSTTRHISLKNSFSSSSSSHLISFTNSHHPPCGNLDSIVEPKNEVVMFNDDHTTISPTYAPQGGQGIKRGTGPLTRSPSHALDHVLAERKRRERLAERIIALSAIIPGLKKAKKKSEEESVVLVNKSNLSADDDSSSCEENSGGCCKESRSEIEARVSENNVLIRVHHEKKKGFVVKMIREIEKLHLRVINSSVLPFGNYNMDITIVAQMDAEFSLTVKDLVRNLRLALL
ncbi:hypothetical protein LguiB_019302 [Lonicera macranthoides]